MTKYSEPHKIITPAEMKTERTFKRGDRVQFCRMFLRNNTNQERITGFWASTGIVESVKKTMEGSQRCIVKFNIESTKKVSTVNIWSKHLEKAE